MQHQDDEFALKLRKLRLREGVGSTRLMRLDRTRGVHGCHSLRVFPLPHPQPSWGWGRPGDRCSLQGPQRGNPLCKPPACSCRERWGAAPEDTRHLSNSADDTGDSCHHLWTTPSGELLGWGGGWRRSQRCKAGGDRARVVWAAPGWATGAADKGVARMALDSAGALGSRSQTPHSSGTPVQLRGKAWGCSWGCCPPEGHAKQVQQPQGLPTKGVPACVPRGPQFDSCLSCSEMLFLSANLNLVKAVAGRGHQVPFTRCSCRPEQSLPPFDVDHSPVQRPRTLTGMQWAGDTVGQRVLSSWVRWGWATSHRKRQKPNGTLVRGQGRGREGRGLRSPRGQPARLPPSGP